MKRVLIVSPHFPPINAPDMQRVRLALPYLHELGWEPTVLAVEPESIEGGVFEPLLEKTYPADIRVVRVRGLSPQLTRRLGIGNVWWRCGRALAAAGASLLREQRFDLVFFSTTLFSAFTLGPKWKRQFGVPYVLDYQDPWVSDYYERTKTRPPGGHLRYALSQWGAKRAEPPVVRAASGIIAVSDSYGPMLARLYPWFDAGRVLVLPFGASPRDFDVARTHVPAQPLVNFDDGNFHHVYTGRAGPDMALALTMLFRAFRRYRETAPALAEKMRFHFIGTGYAPPPLGVDTVLPVAREAGVADFVREHRYRVPYFDTLYHLQRAHALTAIGSDDPGYSASKTFPYILARRPLLMVFHRQSPVLSFAQQVSAGVRFAFEGAGDVARVAEEIHQRWFAAGGNRQVAALDEAAFAPLTAQALTARLAQVFETATQS